MLVDQKPGDGKNIYWRHRTTENQAYTQEMRYARVRHIGHGTLIGLTALSNVGQMSTTERIYSYYDIEYEYDV